ncbi:MAG TPA: hypothetical protein VFD66_09675 [Verrucomicrobiae bacterium]|nr:hypothetical protein [Verrucomicrobiae bacterium]
MSIRVHPWLNISSLFVATAVSVLCSSAQPFKAGESPADHLPPHITRLTTFGERADWSHDGKAILFMSKMFGDAMEIDLATRNIRNLTDHYPHPGYTRALYLANGDILLTGPESFDPTKTDWARRHCWLYVLDKSLSKPAVPLGRLCSEGPAVSRKHMHIAWTQWSESTDQQPPATSKIREADIVYENGKPALKNERTILDNSALPFPCTLETQNFRPPDETELTFSAYNPPGTESDVCSVNLATRQVTNYTHSPNEYDEVEGIYPDGRHVLVECDRQNHLGPPGIDIWKLALQENGPYERLTFFSDFPGYKASNPVVSDDGQFFAFQIGLARNAPGVGHGLFVYDIQKAPQSAH